VPTLLSDTLTQQTPDNGCCCCIIQYSRSCCETRW